MNPPAWQYYPGGLLSAWEANFPILEDVGTTVVHLAGRRYRVQPPLSVSLPLLKGSTHTTRGSPHLSPGNSCSGCCWEKGTCWKQAWKCQPTHCLARERVLERQLAPLFPWQVASWPVIPRAWGWSLWRKGTHEMASIMSKPISTQQWAWSALASGSPETQ